MTFDPFILIVAANIVTSLGIVKEIIFEDLDAVIPVFVALTVISSSTVLSAMY